MLMLITWNRKEYQYWLSSSGMLFIPTHAVIAYNIYVCVLNKGRTDGYITLMGFRRAAVTNYCPLMETVLSL